MTPKTPDEIALLFTGLCAGVDINRDIEFTSDLTVTMKTLAWCLGARVPVLEMFLKLSTEALQVNPEAVMRTAKILCKDFEKEEVKI